MGRGPFCGSTPQRNQKHLLTLVQLKNHCYHLNLGWMLNSSLPLDHLLKNQRNNEKGLCCRLAMLTQGETTQDYSHLSSKQLWIPSYLYRRMLPAWKGNEKRMIKDEADVKRHMLRLWCSDILTNTKVTRCLDLKPEHWTRKAHMKMKTFCIYEAMAINSTG